MVSLSQYSLSRYSLAQYCEILRIDPATGHYKALPLSIARAFLDAKLKKNIDEGDGSISFEDHQFIQRALFAEFLTDCLPQHWEQIAHSGLCLRSCLSYSILAACRKISARFSGYEVPKKLRYQDLLSYVLDDDGQHLIVVESDQSRELHAGELRTLVYVPFAIEVLRRFDPQAQAQLNLDSWAYYQTQQHPEVRRVLSEYGFSLFTDWALLNRVGQQQLAQFSPPEQAIIQAFHGVYRRDRKQLARQQARQRCVEPSSAQLAEMLAALQGKVPPDLTPPQLLSILKQMASQLRRQEIWRKRGAPLADSIEARQATVKTWEIVDTAPADPIAQLATQDVRGVCQQLLQQALQQGIEDSITDYIQALRQRRRYAQLADRVIPALKLLYVEGKSQNEVATALNLSNQSQVSRLLNLKQLMGQVRFRTLTRMIGLLRQRGLGVSLPESVCAGPLAERLETFLDTEIFIPAIAELRTAKRGKSFYADHLRQYIETYDSSLETPSENHYETALSRGEK